MLKFNRLLLTFIGLSIIGGILYITTYVGKTDEKSVQAIKLQEKSGDISDAPKDEILLEQKEEKVVNIEVNTTEVEKNKDKVEEKTATKGSTENKTEQPVEAKKPVEKPEIKEKPPVKTPEYKKIPKERLDMVIVIDPGHASVTSSEKEPQAPGSTIMKVKEPGGAQGINTKTPEYVVNMEVAVRLKSLLEEKGYTVIMTKTEHEQMLGNIARAEVGNEAMADLVIRIHADSSNNTSAKGASMLVPASNENTSAIHKISKRYGEVVLSNLISSIGMKNRGVLERNDLTGFNWSKVPVILVEMGFQSNVEEDKLLASSTYQDKLAKALAEGIDKALVE